jgi:hypothetical protein
MANKLSELKPADYNPRSIDEESFEGLKYSLEEFGDLSGIVFNKATGNLICGHQRRNGLLEKYVDLSIVMVNDEIGCVQTPEGWKYSVRFVDWSLKKEKAANLAANNPKIQGEFNSDVQLLIEEIKLESPDLARSLRIDVIDIPMSTNFDILKDLEENEFVQLVNKSSEIFSITFNFSNEHKPLFEKWIKENSKKELAKMIIQLVKGETNA